MSSPNTTFIVDVKSVLSQELPDPEGYLIRPTVEADADQLAALWFVSFPPDIATDIEAAQTEMRDMFRGDYGEFWPEASPLLVEDKKLVAAICTVVKAPWARTPTCPFIVDMMVDPNSRRLGLAAFLIQETCRVAQTKGHTHVALRVLVDNEPAIALYRKLGFIDWDGELYAPE